MTSKQNRIGTLEASDSLDSVIATSVVSEIFTEGRCTIHMQPMEPRLTEFSYGYCVTEEIRRRLGLMAAPYFPSLYAEGRSGGYDVQIGTALFLQFKLSEELTRKSATETKKRLLQPPFFRFWLHRRDRSDQHQMLVDLESVAGNEVYYIAPAFADVSALNEALTDPKKKGVVGESKMFSPKDLGSLTDDQAHSVAFRSDDDWGWFLSEPKRVEAKHITDAAQRMRAVRVAHGETLQSWLDELIAAMRRIGEGARKQVLGPTLSGDSFGWTGWDRGRLEEAAYLARVYFGCELFLLVSPR